MGCFFLHQQNASGPKQCSSPFQVLIAVLMILWMIPNHKGGGFSTNEDDGDETCKARAKRKILGKYDFSKTVNHPFLGTWMYQELSKW